MTSIAILGATGHLGRTVVMVQMLFDLVFVASAVGLVVSTIVTRSQARAAGRLGERDR